MRSKAEAILATVNEERIWQRLLRNRNARIVLDAMKYLTDRRDGKPVQAVVAEICGGLAVRIAERLRSARKRTAECQTRERAAETSQHGPAGDKAMPTC